MRDSKRPLFPEPLEATRYAKKPANEVTFLGFAHAESYRTMWVCLGHKWSKSVARQDRVIVHLWRRDLKAGHSRADVGRRGLGGSVSGRACQSLGCSHSKVLRTALASSATTPP